MEGEFVSLKDAAEDLQVSRMTLYRRIERAGIDVFKSPHDQRYRMIRAEDLERLKSPEVVQQGKQEPAHNLAA